METKLPTASPKAPEAPSGEVPTKTEGKAPSATDQQESKPAKATVASPEEGSPLSGLGLIEDGQDIAEAMESDSWVAQSLAGFGTAMDMQQLVSDPIQTLMSWGIAWLLDHMSPLNKWLNDLTGDPGEVQGFAGTWASIGETLQSNSSDLARSLVSDLEGQEGAGISAYTALQSDIAQHIELAGTCSNAMSTALGVASTIVQVVHDLVRDAIADIVSAIAEKAAELAISCGTLAPKVIKDVVSLALEWAGKLRKYVDDLLSSSKKLSKLSDDLSNMLTRLKDALANIKSGVKDTIAKHTGKGGDDAAKSTSRLPDEWPPKIDPIVDGGSVEIRPTYHGGNKGNGGYVAVHFDAEGNRLRTEGVFDNTNVVSARQDKKPRADNHFFSRGLHGADDADRKKFNKTHNLKGTGDDAGHMASVRVLPPTQTRLLNEDFPFKDAYGGKYAAAEDPLTKMRDCLHDSNNPANTWDSAMKQANLSDDEKAIVRELYDKESDLTFAIQDSDINRKSFLNDYETPMIDQASGERHFTVDEFGHDAKGRPDKFVASCEKFENGSTTVVVPPTTFRQ